HRGIHPLLQQLSYTVLSCLLPTDFLSNRLVVGTNFLITCTQTRIDSLIVIHPHLGVFISPSPGLFRAAFQVAGITDQLRHLQRRTQLGKYLRPKSKCGGRTQRGGGTGRTIVTAAGGGRSEERRVGKERRWRVYAGPEQEKITEG